LRDFDSENFENVFVKWNSELKLQSHQAVQEICDKLINREEIDFNTLEPVRITDLENETRIGSVILRQFNSNPSVFINTKLHMFITEIAAELYKVSQSLFQFRQSGQDPSKFDKGPDMPDFEKIYFYNCYKAQLLLTSLLLSIEQLSQNEFNPNFGRAKTMDE
jgi:hypothetical protein